MSSWPNDLSNSTEWAIVLSEVEVLEQRNIPQSYPEEIVKNPDEKYFDTETNHSITVKALEYNGEVRPMAVSYDIINGTIQVITIPSC